ICLCVCRTSAVVRILNSYFLILNWLVAVRVRLWWLWRGGEVTITVHANAGFRRVGRRIAGGECFFDRLVEIVSHASRVTRRVPEAERRVFSPPGKSPARWGGPGLRGGAGPPARRPPPRGPGGAPPAPRPPRLGPRRRR